MSYNLAELEGLSEEERKVAVEILEQFSNKGKSKIYEDILYQDYEEIPVDIETFMRDPLYLGKGLTNEEGVFTVFPYWVKVLKKIFPNNLETKYRTAIFSGAIGLGKSTIAVIGILYQLYRMLCLKDPYLFYGLQPVDLITFAFMNITIDAAEGVAWNKAQQLLQASPWFMSKGTISGTTNPTWKPPKGIELIAGSLQRHIIGRAVFSCLDGDTIINTTKGDFKIKDLVDKNIKVFNIDKNGNLLESNTCTVKPTVQSCEEYKITLEDGTIINCTPNHRFLLKDGITYKEAQELTENDELFDYNNFGYVYKTTNLLNGKYYIGQHKKSYFDKNYYGSGILITRSIKKYGKNNFKIEALEWAKSLDELNKLEEKYISENINNNLCINISRTAVKGNQINIGCKGKLSITNGIKNKFINIDEPLPLGWYYGALNKGKIAITNGNETKFIFPDEELDNGWYYGMHTKGANNPNYKLSWTKERREQQSNNQKGNKNSQYGKGYLHKGELNGRYGKEVSIETRNKISKANLGKIRTEEFKQRISNKLKGKKKPKNHGNHVRQSISKWVYIIDGKKLYGDNELIKYVSNVYNYRLSSLGIESILEKRKRAISLYPLLINKIERRLNNDENN